MKPTDPGAQAARQAVRDHMAQKSMDPAALARDAGIDPGTTGDFLRGRRWPRLPTLAKIDTALGWEPGTLARIAAGEEPVPRSQDDQPRRMYLDIHPESYEDLSDHELAEATATATAVFLQKVREIRSGRPMA